MKFKFLTLIFLAIFVSCKRNEPQNKAAIIDKKSYINIDNQSTKKNLIEDKQIIEPIARKSKVSKTKLKPIENHRNKIEIEEEEGEGKLSKYDRIKESLEDEIKRTKDPATGIVPKGVFAEALAFTQRKQMEFYGKNEERGASLANAKWKERGPTNVGGRVGTILLDKNDPTNKTLFVGHCSGGLWKTTDITAARPIWKPVNDYLQNLAIGGIVQDPTNPKIMYLGTGDPSADDVKGIGIFKSTDGGENWQLLPSTNNANFVKTREIVITNDGSIYAACNSGVRKSTNGGSTWVRVLDNNIWDLTYISSINTLFASKTNSIWKSTIGNQGTWTDITDPTNTGFPSNWERTEFSISQSDPEIIYAVGNQGSANTAVMKTTDGGLSWYTTGLNAGLLTGSQAWYDLDIAVDPTNSKIVYAGGVDLFRTLDGGNSWKRVSEWSPKTSNTYVHADQHYIYYEPNNGNVCYFGNDGGIFACRNAAFSGQPNIEDKNTGYNTTLFYYGAIHPDKYSNYFLGGAQDNGSNQINSYSPGVANEVTGGDGFWVHIDQTKPNIQFTTLYNGIFHLSEDGGKSFTGGVNTNGAFRTFGAYDDKNHILFAQSYSADFYRYNVITKISEPIKLSSGSVGYDPSCMTVDPNDPSILYIGNKSGIITKVSNATTGNSLSGKILTSPSNIAGGSGTISSIDIEKGNSNHIIVSLSNYNLKNNIVESKDGGITWIGVEGTNAFPNIPVRWAIFDPKNASRAMIATEMGVWTTDNLDGANTVWFPPVPGRGTPLVRTDHLEYRASDNVVMAATWGRGIWTSDVFADIEVAINSSNIGYIYEEIKFEPSSHGAESFLWDFGDNSPTSTEDVVTHSYAQKGNYEVSLTINNNLTTKNIVKILPDKDLPYVSGSAGYGGDFTANDEQYGVYTVSGSGWEKGTSNFPVKNNGSNVAFIIAPNKNYYDSNSESYLYLPNFNMSTSGIYEFSFNTKFKTHEGPDGFNIEYSIDRGKTWKQLGSTSDKNWYNSLNDGTFYTFNKGASYFTGEQLKLAKFSLNISDLSGPGYENVAFRFVFKSDYYGSHAGVLIDDVQISKFDGELKTVLIDNTAAFSDNQGIAINVNWSTLPEYKCKKFEVEYSDNAKDFVKSGTVIPNGTTATRQNYSHQIKATNKALYFVRIKVINEYDTSYSSIMVVKKDLNNEDLFNYYPNPFSSNVQFLFTDLINKNVKFELFDAVGRLIYSKSDNLSNQAYYDLEVPEIPSGKYTCRVTMGTNEPILINLVKYNK